MFAVRNKFASFGFSCFSSLQKALNQPSLGSSFVLNRHAFPNLTWARPYSETAVPPKVLISKTNDPFFDISVEDYLLQTADLTKPILYIWRNEPTVFIGRNQNPWKECFLQEMEKDNVHLVRRFSGGGAVYQDLGNTCWTFLHADTQHSKEQNMQLLSSALSHFGIKSQASGRNDLILEDGRKISGSAFKMAKKKVCHHGTMLLHVDLAKMQRYLNPNKEKLKSKGVESVRARVANLCEVYGNTITHDSLSDALLRQFIEQHGPDTEITTLDHNRLKTEPKLNEIFLQMKDWAWRFGETPDFQHNLEKRFDWGIIDIWLDSREGRIEDVVIFSDSLFPDMISAAAEKLKGEPYTTEGIHAALTKASHETSLQEKGADPAKFLLEMRDWLVSAM